MHTTGKPHCNLCGSAFHYEEPKGDNKNDQRRHWKRADNSGIGSGPAATHSTQLFRLRINPVALLAHAVDLGCVMLAFPQSCLEELRETRRTFHNPRVRGARRCTLHMVMCSQATRTQLAPSCT